MLLALIGLLRCHHFCFASRVRVVGLCALHITSLLEPSRKLLLLGLARLGLALVVEPGLQ